MTVPVPLAGRVNERAIRDALVGAHSVAAVSREVVHERRPRIGSDARGITPQQALERYLEGRTDLTDETRRLALERGLELVAEETARE